MQEELVVGKWETREEVTEAVLVEVRRETGDEDRSILSLVRMRMMMKMSDEASLFCPFVPKYFKRKKKSDDFVYTFSMGYSFPHA